MQFTGIFSASLDQEAIQQMRGAHWEPHVPLQSIALEMLEGDAQQGEPCVGAVAAVVL